MPSQVDTRPFTVGGNLGITPGQVVHRTEVFEADPVRRDRDEGPPAPVVVIPQINKYYITDLAPGRSLVESTVAAGLPYFTLAGATPRPNATGTSTPTPPRAMKRSRVACDIAGSDDANVAGVCAGGVTLAALLGHLAATGESSLVNSVTFLVAGLDTTTETIASNLMSRRAVEAARKRSLRAGVLAGEDMARSSPGCDRTTSCGTTGSTTTSWATTRRRSTSCTGTTTPRLPAGTPRLPRPVPDQRAVEARSRCSERQSISAGELRQLRGRRLHRPPHPLGRRLPDPSCSVVKPVRAQQRRSHPGDPQPAGQPEGVLLHVRLAAGDRRQAATAPRR